MSLVSKLIGAALTVGTAAAVGYGMKKLGEKAEEMLNPPDAEEENTREILGTANSKITLKEDKSGEWSYTIKNKGIVKERVNDSGENVRKFDFAALKDGVTELEFDYKAKGSDTPQRTITYNIEVKNGKIIRCDAAGDLEMIEK